MRRVPSEPVPVSLLVAVLMRNEDVDEDEARRRLALPLQEVGYPPDVTEVSVPDAVALLDRVDAGIVRPAETGKPVDRR